MEIKVLKNILSANEQLASTNRQSLDKEGIFALNVMSSPGAGKTSLILETAKQLKGKAKAGVIEGDVASSVDAETISREGIPVLQINTGAQCHLDASMIQGALHNLPLQDIDVLFIENVGNLICTAEFTLGEHVKLVISSVTEGHDKPLKYPLMFTVADVVIINKIDLLPYVKFDTDAYNKAVKALNDRIKVFEISCTTGQGIETWTSWLLTQLRRG